MLALSYMGGKPVIDNWIKNELKRVDARIDDDDEPIRTTDERTWRLFQKDFDDAFTNTTKTEDAEAELERLQIQQDETVDQYIARFEDLAERADWDLRNDKIVPTSFRKGLREGMQKAIFLKDPVPKTYQEWKDAARCEASRYALMKSAGMFGNQKGGSSSAFKFRSQKAQQRWGKFTKDTPKCDPDAMDVDALQVNQLTAEDKQQCIKEGRCFRCQNTGHRSRECPTKRKNDATAQFAAQTQRSAIRSREVVDDRDDDAKSEGSNATKITSQDAIRTLKSLATEERLKMIDEMFAEDQDFQ
jgi:hypothetical protein